MPTRYPRGFTLIELLVVVAVIGILAAIALPAYRDYVLRGKITEATSTLADMRMKLEQYYQDNTRYSLNAGGAGGCGVASPTAPAVRHFTYLCTNPGPSADAFLATATGKADEGMGGFTYTINQNNGKATTSVPAGWTSNATCWVTRKDGSC